MTQMMIIVSFYIIGAYATTDILRLSKGNPIAVWDKDCYCPQCGGKILMRDQVPIIGYVFSKGACRQCGKKIPFSDLFLEIFLFAALACTAAALDFSRLGFLLCVVLYEGTKTVYLVRIGRREDNFVWNMMYSFLSNMPVFSLVAFLFLIHQINQ